MPGTSLSTLCLATMNSPNNLIGIVVIRCDSNNADLTREDVETQKGKITHPTSHS